MARLTGPLFSLGASGTVAKTLTFGSWKGIAFVRKHVIPANPDTADQQEVRGIFTTLSNLWKHMGVYARASWIAATRGRALTDRNLLVQLNAAALQADSDLNDLVMAAPSGSATEPTGLTAAGGVGVIDVTGTPAAAPIGYTLAGAILLAVADGDPSPAIDRVTYEDYDAAPACNPGLAGLVADTYQAAIIAHYTRDADGVDFYSSAIRSQETVT